MSTPKSTKLLREESSGKARQAPVSLVGLPEAEPQHMGPVKIRPIQCLNDFVAVLLFRVQSDIQLPNSQQFRNEGIVVGIGPGLPDNAGGRVKSQLEIGDVVTFQDRSIVLDVNSDKPPYKGQRVIIIPERSLICKLPKVEFTVEE